MRTQWTPERFTSELKTICAGLGRMPTNSELLSLGRSDLANKITDFGGFVSVAADLGVKRLHTDSDTGWDGEMALATILTEKGFKVKRETEVKAPHDLIVDDVLRIDVKTANYAEYGVCKGWFYRIGKLPQADVIALYQLDTKNVYFLPWTKCPKTNASISRDGGKYAQFKNRFDLLRTMIASRLTEQAFWEAA